MKMSYHSYLPRPAWVKVRKNDSSSLLTLMRTLTNLVKETPKSELYRSMQMVPFTESEPFEYKVKCEEFSGLKLAVYHEKSNKNAKALCFFLHDFGVSAKNFGSLFH